MSVDACNDAPEHIQVPYVTKSGKKVTVDANMAFTMELLKLLGVETYYSCEGKKRTKTFPSTPAYILGNGRDLLRLEMRIKKLRKQGKLSDEAVETARMLFGKRHTININHFAHDKNGRQMTRFEMTFGDVGYHRGPVASVTKCYSTTYGFRINWKWGPRKTSEVARLLAEVLQFA